MISGRPTTAATAKPEPIALPTVARSGVQAQSLAGQAAAEPEAHQHLVDNDERAVTACHVSTCARYPGAASMQPALASIGSIITAATSSSLREQLLDVVEVIVAQEHRAVASRPARSPASAPRDARLAERDVVIPAVVSRRPFSRSGSRPVASAGNAAREMHRLAARVGEDRPTKAGR